MLYSFYCHLWKKLTIIDSCFKSIKFGQLCDLLDCSLKREYSPRWFLFLENVPKLYLINSHCTVFSHAWIISLRTWMIFWKLFSPNKGNSQENLYVAIHPCMNVQRWLNHAMPSYLLFVIYFLMVTKVLFNSFLILQGIIFFLIAGISFFS